MANVLRPHAGFTIQALSTLELDGNFGFPCRGLSKKWGEQAAAVVCLRFLGLDEGKKRSLSTLNGNSQASKEVEVTLTEDNGSSNLIDANSELNPVECPQSNATVTVS